MHDTAEQILFEPTIIDCARTQERSMGSSFAGFARLKRTLQIGDARECLCRVRGRATRWTPVRAEEGDVMR